MVNTVPYAVQDMFQTANRKAVNHAAAIRVLHGNLVDCQIQMNHDLQLVTCSLDMPREERQERITRIIDLEDRMLRLHHKIAQLEDLL